MHSEDAPMKENGIYIYNKAHGALCLRSSIFYEIIMAGIVRWNLHLHTWHIPSSAQSQMSLGLISMPYLRGPEVAWLYVPSYICLLNPKHKYKKV